MFKKVSLIIILVLALASGFYFFKENSKPNYISSKPMPKPAPFLKHTSKLQSPFTIKFENNNSDVQEGDQFTLTAIISSNMNIDELELKWMAGDGLEHIVGKLE